MDVGASAALLAALILGALGLAVYCVLEQERQRNQMRWAEAGGGLGAGLNGGLAARREGQLI